MFSLPDESELLKSMPEGMNVDYGTDEDTAFGLWHPIWYAIDTWQQYREHGTYPYPGAYNDQPQIWIDDNRALNARLVFHTDAARKALEDERSR